MKHIPGQAYLTPKQCRFIDEYLTDLNATQAAIRAGYSAKTAASMASVLLIRPHIVAAVQQRQKALQGRVEVCQETVIEELRRVAFSDLREYMSWGPDGVTLHDSKALTGTAAAAIQSVKCKVYTRTHIGEDGTPVPETEVHTEIRLYDKLRALEGLGKRLGLFVDRHRLEMDPLFLQEFVAKVLTYVPDTHAREALVHYLQTAIGPGAPPGDDTPTHTG